MKLASVQFDTYNIKVATFYPILEEIKKEYTLLQKQLELEGLKFEFKIDLLNQKLFKQLELTLIEQEIKLTQEMQNTNANIRDLKLKIEGIEKRLPEITNICGRLNNCGKCTANPSCGWCSTSQSCVLGNEKGPLVGKCSFYDFTSCIGPKDCSEYSNCDVRLLNFYYF